MLGDLTLLCGTSGSGKTHIARALLAALGEPAGELKFGPRNGTGGYIWPSVAVMGRYDATCGGCDLLSWRGAPDEIEGRILEQRAVGRKVFLEGLIVGSWGIARLVRLIPQGLLVIQLSTPLEECLAAVEARRAARGGLKPLNPANTIEKHRGFCRGVTARRSNGIPVEELNREDAARRVLGIFAGG